MQQAGFICYHQSALDHSQHHNRYPPNVSQLRCQLPEKFYGSVVSALSMFFSLFIFLVSNKTCSANFHLGDAPFDLQNTTLSQQIPLRIVSGLPDASIEVDLAWGAGNAFVCMCAATWLKIIDIIANLVVPTPSITRDKGEQVQYEALYRKRKSSENRTLTDAVGQCDVIIVCFCPTCSAGQSRCLVHFIGRCIRRRFLMTIRARLGDA